MKILHIINDYPDKKVLNIVEEHKQHHDVKLIYLYQNDVNYSTVIEEVKSADKVFSWNNENQRAD